MKKFLKTAACTMTLAMLLSVSAMAAPTVTPVDKAALEFDGVTDEKIETLAYFNDDIAEGGQYMVFVVDGELPTASTILYINQNAAEEDGVVYFENVYPKEMRDSKIMVSGTGLGGLQTVAEIEIKGEPVPVIVKGDVTGDGKVVSADAMLLLQYVAGLVENFSDAQVAAGDVTGDGKVVSADAMLLLQYVAGLAELN